MVQIAKSEQSLVFSYLTLRKVIGILGVALPLVVSIGAWLFFRIGIQRSISSYYHTGMRDVFVGTLFAIGFFLLSYKGYERADNIAGNLGCIFAIGVALFPTTPDTQLTTLVGKIHFTFTALFFITLIYFSYFLFTKTDPSRPPSPEKLQRNQLYQSCAYVMGMCMLLIVCYNLLPTDMAVWLENYKPVYWLEAIAIWAFGISWLTKGEAILKDEVNLPNIDMQNSVNVRAKHHL